MITINFNETKYKEICREFDEKIEEYEKEGASHEELYDLYRCIAEDLDTLITDALYAEKGE